MSAFQRPYNFALAALAVLAGALSSCGGGGGSGGGNPATGALRLVSISVTEGATWELNRSVRLEFSRAVDPAVLGSSSVRITAADGLPAAGQYLLEEPDVLVFEPACPLDLSLDGFGFRRGVDYVLVVEDQDDAAPVLAADGAELLEGASIAFTAADGTDAADVLWDPIVGAPSPIVRPIGSQLVDSSRVVIGEQGVEEYFEFVPSTGAAVPIDDLPLNLPSTFASQVCVALLFDQPIDPSPANLARLGLERQLPSGTWQSIAVDRVPVSNLCSEGVRVDLKPTFVLPADTLVRVVVDAGFEDIIGDASTVRRDGFALMRTGPYSAGYTFDLFENFDQDPGQTSALVDATTGELVQPAKWENGRLSAVAGFAGSGGPGGNFDLFVKPGQILELDTDGDVVMGGPNGATNVPNTLVNGVLEVRNLTVELGGTLRARGSHPLFVRATQNIRVFGRIDVSGANGSVPTPLTDVSTLGGRGGPAGGRGGVPVPIQGSAAMRGGNGEAPPGIVGQGGFGGETAYGPQSVSWMFGGGGGGGCLAIGAAGVAVPLPSAGAGHPLVFGAESKALKPKAGALGLTPFDDGDVTNDFCGIRRLTTNNTLVVGELEHVSGGCGGGAGGDSVIGAVYPNPIAPANEYRGGTGGGGGGALVLSAREDVVFGSNGRIFANGGAGSKGQAFSLNLALGGGGGGGSGGWIVIEAGDQVDMRLLGFEALEARGGLGANGGGSDPTIGRGSDGGPGVIQIHVQEVEADLLLPFGASLATRTEPNGWVLVPRESNTSRALSAWIPLPVGPTEANGLVDLVFGGVDLATGRPIDSNGDGQLDDLPAVLGPTLVGNGPSLPFVAADGYTLVVSGAPLVGTPNGRLLDQPELLVGYVIVLKSLDGTKERHHTVEAAVYEPAPKRLRLTASTSEGSIEDSVEQLGDWVNYSLHPRHLLVVSGSKRDWLDPRNEITVRFQLANADASLAPDVANAGPWTTNLDGQSLTNRKFVRFEVLFRVSPEVVALDNVELLPALEFLRIYAVR
jgi:hypothetical protein